MSASIMRDHITLPVAGVHLKGDLAVPLSSHALVLFAHGSGGSRKNHRNREVARALEQAGFATLLLDLLTGDEDTAEHTAMARAFDVGPLAERLLEATDWISAQPALRGFVLGYFGAGSGAAVALVAAAERPATVRAIVSQAGRTDLADGVLAHLDAPTLLIVGTEDGIGLQHNRDAVAKMHCECALAPVSGASHLFAEPGALDRVAALAATWFAHHLVRRGEKPKSWGPGGPSHCESFRPGHRLLPT